MPDELLEDRPDPDELPEDAPAPDEPPEDRPDPDELEALPELEEPEELPAVPPPSAPSGAPLDEELVETESPPLELEDEEPVPSSKGCVVETPAPQAAAHKTTVTAETRREIRRILIPQ